MLSETDKRIDDAVVAKLRTYPQAIMEYYKALLSTGKTYRTAQTYITVVTHFANYIMSNGKSVVPLYDSNPVSEFYEGIESDDIEQFLYALNAKKDAAKEASQETKATNWTALNSFFEFLTPKYIGSNPVQKVARPEVKKKSTYYKLPPIAKQIILNAPISELNLPTRTLNVLKQANIYTIGDLCDLSVEECCRISCFGMVSLRAVQEVLSAIGCSLRTDERKRPRKDENGNVIATKDDWKTEAYPDIFVTVDFILELSKEQRAILKRGYIPSRMEHKWFYYYERGKLYIYRSWTGKCFYIVKLNEVDSKHCAIAYAYDAKNVGELQKTAGEKNR